jgi:alkanesulfonate monooxygenase SsuD/methylene tetrahydromethanopterin reductase-like flavin-dependent oxidoreductase (luciferase family)
MRIGLFMMPLHRPERDYAGMLAEDAEAILHADRVGFEEAWVGEHYTAKTEPITSPLIFMATLIERTRQIKFGTGVISLPHHHPAVIAGQVAMFDHLAKGRFLFGIGPGGLPCDLELFKTLDRQDRMHMQMEAIDLILEIWRRDPPYALKGKYWDVVVEKTVNRELGLGPMVKPYQRPHPPIAIPVLGRNAYGARVAGGRGYGLISANFVPAVNVASHWQMYREGAAEAGRDADARDWRVARSVLVTESDAEAEDYLARPDNGVRFYYRYLRDQLVPVGMGGIFKVDPAMPDEDVTVDYLLAQTVIAGSPATVTAKLAALREQVGPFDTLLAAFHEWDEPELWRRSMARLANDVVPRLR